MERVIKLTFLVIIRMLSRQRHAVMSASIACKYFSRLNPRVELTTRVYLKAPFLTAHNVKLNLMIGFFFSFFTKDDKGTTPTQMCRA